MFKKTDTDFAPWYIVRSDDKRGPSQHVAPRALGDSVQAARQPTGGTASRVKTRAYNDRKSIATRRFVEDYY
jgi:hypothetical protein